MAARVVARVVIGTAGRAASGGHGTAGMARPGTERWARNSGCGNGAQAPVRRRGPRKRGKACLAQADASPGRVARSLAKTESPGRAAPDLARLPITLNPRAISLAEGIRAALSVAVIIALNEYLQWPPLIEAAIAALWTCLCDPGGPIRRRIPVLLWFTVCGAALAAGLGLIRGLGIGVALPAGAFALFALAFARVFGQAGQQIGNMLCFDVILALDQPLPDLHAAVLVAAGFLAGGFWAAFLTLAIWRVYPFQPARRAVAEVYRRLAGLAADLRGLLSAAGDAAQWEAHARAHRGGVRQAIEAARAVVFDTVRTRGGMGGRGAHSLIRLEAAEQIFGALIALSELAEQEGANRRAVERMLRRLRPLLLVLGSANAVDTPLTNPRVARSLDALAAEVAALPADSKLRAPAVQIVERLRIAHTLALPQNFAPGVDPAGRRAKLGQRAWQPVRANLTWRSPSLRHAARIAAMASPALAFTMLHFNEFDHWLTFAIVGNLQPYFALTYAGALERVGGTALGGLAAAGIGLLCRSPLAIAVAMFPLCIVAFAVRAVSLGLFMATLTPLVVLLVESVVPGLSEWTIAAARFGLTALGGVCAVAAAFVLWPTREPERLGEEAGSAIRAHGAYAAAVLAAASGSAGAGAAGAGAAGAGDVEAARRAAGLASNSLESSISRAMAEPGTQHRERIAAALVIDAALRRMAGRLSAMQLDSGLGSALAPADLAAWRIWIRDGMAAVAAGITSLPPRPATPEVDSLVRVARQVELMAGAMGRL